jgi:hypothetical protein
LARKISASNAVVSACEETCHIYRVPVFRMQSRAINVIGVGGRSRPMFMGAWRDGMGVEHKSGMADLLATPQVGYYKRRAEADEPMISAVPLWIECKSGTGKLSDDQIAFREFVEDGGAYFLEIHDSADALLAWFKAFGVQR